MSSKPSIDARQELAELVKRKAEIGVRLYIKGTKDTFENISIFLNSIF